MKEGRFNSFPLPRCVIVETIIPGPRWDANGMISFRNCGELQRLSIVNDMFNSCRGIDNLNKEIETRMTIVWLYANDRGCCKLIRRARKKLRNGRIWIGSNYIEAFKSFESFIAFG